MVILIILFNEMVKIVKENISLPKTIAMKYSLFNTSNYFINVFEFNSLGSVEWI
jgi:hypothetical protein